MTPLHSRVVLHPSVEAQQALVGESARLILEVAEVSPAAGCWVSTPAIERPQLPHSLMVSPLPLRTTWHSCTCWCMTACRSCCQQRWCSPWLVLLATGACAPAGCLHSLLPLALAAVSSFAGELAHQHLQGRTVPLTLCVCSVLSWWTSCTRQQGVRTWTSKPRTSSKKLVEPCIFWTSRACPMWTHVSGPHLHARQPTLCRPATAGCMQAYSAAQLSAAAPGSHRLRVCGGQSLALSHVALAAIVGSTPVTLPNIPLAVQLPGDTARRADVFTVGTLFFSLLVSSWHLACLQQGPTQCLTFSCRTAVSAESRLSACRLQN